MGAADPPERAAKTTAVRLLTVDGSPAGFAGVVGGPAPGNAGAGAGGNRLLMTVLPRLGARLALAVLAAFAALFPP